MRQGSHGIAFLLRKRSAATRYGAVGVVCLLFTAVARILERTGAHPYWAASLGLIATVMCSLIGGYGPGLLGGFVTALIVDLKFIQPVGTVLDTPESFFNFFLFCAVSLIVASLIAGLRSAYSRSTEALAASEAALRSRDHVISVVSHDLKNPLGTIVLNTELMLRGPEHSPSDPAFKRSAENILVAAERMRRIIQDLLDAAKMETGRLPVELKPESPAEMIRVAFNSFEATAESKRISLRKEVEENLPPVCCDSGRVLQVLTNFLDNAMKFTPAGGSVLVKAHGTDGSVLFSVQDTGVGIPREKISHVFERFWQVDERSKQGVGLGLFISKGIIQAHHGKIWAQSAPGEGTTMSFTLPVA